MRVTGIIIILLILIAVVFLYAPLPGIEQPDANRASSAQIEQAASIYFETIRDADNLQRRFPEMPGLAANPQIPEKIELGKLLFYDPILSGDNSVSCAHCHHPDLGYSDNRPLSMGRGGSGIGIERTGGDVIRRNTPTIWNTAFNHLQYWDGRAADLEEQARSPIETPEEMDQDPVQLIEELKSIPAYEASFQQVFPDRGITFDTIVEAIASFERTIITTDSPFDRYAAGDESALTPSQRSGLNIFRSLKTRCFECHNFPTFNNPDFKVIGVPPHPDLEAPDLGRGEIAGEGYNGAFKVPTLRNVALTAPYMHNGIFGTLEEVIDFYALGGGPGMDIPTPNIDDKIRPFALTPDEKADLIAFLHALTDDSNLVPPPNAVPSGLPVVPRLQNQSAELRLAPEPEDPRPVVDIERVGQVLHVREGQRIQDAVDRALKGDTVLVHPGVYHETIAIDKSDLVILGYAPEDIRPVLDGRNTLSDGIVGSGSRLEFRNLDVKNYTSNGLMINQGMDILFRDLYVENTGLYGVYPVELIGVLVERTTVTGARDAGIYVGQSKDIIVRESVAYGNVTGIEIENSINALVEDNEVYDNAGGVLVFLLPNNPSKVAIKCRVIGNKIYANNHVNFADPTAIVATVPSGSGVIILAADEVEVAQNDIRDNKSFGVSIANLHTTLSSTSGFDVDPIPERNWVHSNNFTNNGYDPDKKITDLGFGGADLLWDGSGFDNSWDQPGATSIPPSLPGSDWSGLRRRANFRLWQTLIAVAG